MHHRAQSLYNIKLQLNDALQKYYNTSFIDNDPIQIPHLFNQPQDIEIAGFLTALFAWGNRKTIIQKATQLMNLFDNTPHQFVLYHKKSDLKSLLNFKHRTFNSVDIIYILEFLQQHYKLNDSLETAFNIGLNEIDTSIEIGLINFKKYFSSFKNCPARSLKHISSPDTNSSCKRLNMFLRWMVRNDNAGIDFGLWKTIHPNQLVIPMDVHVSRVAYSLQILPNEKSNWEQALQLTQFLKKLNKEDPVIYDYALFSLGVNGDIN